MTSIIIDHLSSFFIIFLTFILLLFTYKDLIKEKPFTSLLIVISTLGFSISFLINFNLNLGKYLIGLFYFLTFIYFVYKISFKKESLLTFLKNYYKFLGFVVLSGIISLIYLLFNLNYTFIFNGHDPYFYGIPFEIIEGDYFTRIKVWDNYPYEWSKYHFFNGSLYSIFLYFTGVKNLFLWKLLKLTFFSFSCFLLEEVSKGFHKQNLIFISIIICINSIGWMFSTNGEFSALFLLSGFFLYLKKDTFYSFLFLVFFTCTLSRNLIPGTFLILLFFSNHLFKYFKTRSILLIIPPILNLFSTICFGKTPLKRDINFFLEGKFIGDLVYNGWSDLLFTNSIPKLFIDSYKMSLGYVDFFLLLSSFIYFLIFLKTNYYKIKFLLGLNLFLTISLFLSRGILEKFSTSLLDYNFITITFLILQSFVFWIFVFYVINIYVTKNVEKIKLFLVVVSLGLNIFLFGSGVGIPTLYFFDVLIVFLLIGPHEYLFPKKINYRMLSFLFIILIFLLPRFEDTTQHFFDLKNIDFIEIKRLQNDKNKRMSTEELYILNSNIFGKRINEDKIDTDRLSISKNFIFVNE